MYAALRPALFALDAERAHEVACAAARLCQIAPAELVRPWIAPRDPRLRVAPFGVPMPGPVALAAGCDKNARLIRFWSLLGFGAIEVGSATLRPGAGNPRPRAFRLPADRALVNRLGLGNEGAARIARRLAALPRGVDGVPVGVNIAKTHDPELLGEAALEDMAGSYRLLAPHARWVTLNVSCPNTAEGKTFEDPAALDRLLARIGVERASGAAPPLLVKLSPPGTGGVDAGALREQLAVMSAHEVAGVVAGNTATDRSGLMTGAEELARIGRGGLSGRPLEARATALVRAIFRATDGRLPVAGVGGVDSAEAAYRKIRAGARWVQLYTGLVYEGPGLPARIGRGLLRLLDRDGLSHLDLAVGLDV